ncbi:tetratricopeptide repeat protein [Geomonas sp. Red69]|uniref:tetratricopeptide repeat protein n=1 Tax=Geomonas diazotrophica TaxID=2843197 RepID=UPI001C11E467|nr:tetratricopeptide repeat protein [Geomonas diazotrophica]MBU5637933.1 tetratricopeptide repeat protein [Geomonas diazotrophica]
MVIFCLLFLLLALTVCHGGGLNADGAQPAVSQTAGEDDEIRAARTDVERQPGVPQPLIHLGYLLVASGKPEEALTRFDQVLVLVPKSFEAKTGRGMALARLGRLQEAERELRSALLMNPNPVRTHYELGLVYRQLGDEGKALEQFKEGIRKYEQGRQ